MNGGPEVRILVGHVVDQLATLPDASVHCAITSPPYWGLRDYSRCGCAATYDIARHSGNNITEGYLSPRPKSPNPNCPKCHGTGKDDSLTVDWGDWVGQIGLEPTPDLYVKHVVQVFREVRRVLRDDGTLWLNLGDSYAAGGPAGGAGKQHPNHGSVDVPYRAAPPGLKPKDLVGIPWRVAFALQADGWWLRSDIIWSKPNPMPESVTDRPTRAHEYVFLMTKNAHYFYDSDAVREPHSENTHLAKSGTRRSDGGEWPFAQNYELNTGLSKQKGLAAHIVNPGGRNLRSVWTIPTAPYPEAHFATFPPRLVEPCVKAGTSEKGCCATCGAPWVRVVERGPKITRRVNTENPPGQSPQGNFATARWDEPPSSRTIGFRPTCDHEGEPVSCVILDPFAGSGTVGEVARALGRSAILIEIKEEYAELARKRCDIAQKGLELFPGNK